MSSDLGEIDGFHYRIGGRLSAERQFHIARRLTKALSPAGEQIVALLPKVLSTLKDEKSKPEPLDAARLITPLMQAIGNMSDEESEYILHWCLSIVQRKAPAADLWTIVWDQNGYRFADISMPTLLTLTVKVIMDQLSSFFPGGLSRLGLQTPGAQQ